MSRRPDRRGLPAPLTAAPLTAAPLTAAPLTAAPLTAAALTAVARDVARDVARLVVPVCCAGCGEPDVVWCRRCAPALDDVARREEGCPRLDRMDAAPPVPVWTAGSYAGPVRAAVPAWKDGGRHDLSPVMAGAVRRAARAAGDGLAGLDLVVVGVPTSAAARRRRGMDGVGLLADAVADELGARRARGLLVRHGGRAQVGRGARARGTVSSEYRLGRGVVVGVAHLLVDDVVTTGATLAACSDRLTEAGALVVGAVAIAATPGFTRSRLLPEGSED